MSKEIQFSSENGQRYYIHGNHKYFIKATKNEVGNWQYQLRVLSLVPVGIKRFETPEKAITYVERKNARLVYENNTCRKYNDHVFDYIVTGSTVRIDRVDYGVGMVFDNYQDCMHAAKREIWRMISPATVDEKVGDMQ